MRFHPCSVHPSSSVTTFHSFECVSTRLNFFLGFFRIIAWQHLQFKLSLAANFLACLCIILDPFAAFNTLDGVATNSFSRHCKRIVTIIISGIVISLSGVDVVFCFGHYFRYSPVYKPLLVYFILEAILLVVISSTSPVDKIFSGLFSKRFYRLFFG